MTEKQRSIQQNKSIHKYCTEVANMLNESGITKQVFYRNVESDYTMENIKDLWRAFAKAKYNKEHTAELTSHQVTQIYEEVNRHISQFGLHVAFPSQDLTNEYLESIIKSQ